MNGRYRRARGSRRVRRPEDRLGQKVMGELNVVFVDAGRGAPPGLEQLVRSGMCTVHRVAGLREASGDALGTADAVLVACDDQSPKWSYEHDALLEHLHARRIGAVVVGGPDDCVRRGEPSLVTSAGWDMPADELWGRLSTMARYRPLLNRIEREMISVERLGKRLNEHLVQMDQEMRLASRLQQDFLPRQLPQLGPTRFATLYRPATFVSGDIYDVTRVDEDHVAFYVADAMGHGVAAGLLTMFIKNAVHSKKIHDDGYQLIPPDQTLAELNEMLAIQEMSNGQFATACYCLLNFRTLQLRIARAGHPYPIRISRDGLITELKSEGGLLGLFEGEQYACRTVQLAPGDRLVLYTDGLESELAESVRNAPTLIENPRFTELANQPADQLIADLSGYLDMREGSLDPSDDVTVVILEVATTAPDQS